MPTPVPQTTTMSRALSLFACALLATASAFDFDEEVIEEVPAGGKAFFSPDTDGPGAVSVTVSYSFGTTATLSVREPSSLSTSGRLTARTTPAKANADVIETLQKMAAAGGYYTVSMPSLLSDAASAPVFASASACALLASRFSDQLHMTMDPSKSRITALSYTLPVVPPRCPTAGPLPRIALDEVLFNTTASMTSPNDGPKPLGKVHEASFLPPAAAAAARGAAQQQQGQGGGPAGGEGGEGGEGQQPPQSFLRKYWMYILPVVVLLTMGGGDEPQGDGKGGGGEGGGGGGGGARPAAAAAGGAQRRR